MWNKIEAWIGQEEEIMYKMVQATKISRNNKEWHYRSNNMYMIPFR